MCDSFCIGDFVAASHDAIDYNHKIKAGMIGMVVSIAEYEGGRVSIGIQWDADIGGHTCEGHCPYGLGWYVSPKDIVLVKNAVQEISAEELSSLLCEVV